MDESIGIIEKQAVGERSNRGWQFRRLALATALTLTAACTFEDNTPNTLPPLPGAPIEIGSTTSTITPSTTIALENITIASTVTLETSTTITDTIAPISTEAPTIETPTATTLSSTTLAAEQINCEFEHNTSGVSNRRVKGSIARSKLVGTEAETGDHDAPGECYERFVIRLGGELNESFPGWRVRYIDASSIEDTSGEVIDTKGNALLQITVGSSMYARGGGEGPQRIINPELELIKEAVLTQNRKGQMTWTIVLDKKRNFSVSELSGVGKCPVLCVYVDVGDK